MCKKCGNRDSRRVSVISGAQFGIEFYDLPYKTEKGITDPNPQFRILSEDDELWHQTGCSASVLWLKDLAKVVDRAIKLAGVFK